MTTLLEPQSDTKTLLTNALIVELSIGLLTNKDPFKPVANEAQKIRQIFYSLTVPWGRDGVGICQSIHYEVLNCKLEAAKLKFIIAVEECLNSYVGNKDEVKHKFYANWAIRPIEQPDFANEFMAAEEVQSINEKIEAQTSARLRVVNLNLLNRVRDRLIKLIERLAMPDCKFHVSNFTNLSETLIEVRALNVSGDEKLDSLFEDIQDRFVAIKPIEVRENDVIRNDALIRATECLIAVNDVINVLQ